ncbi:hypothetical protein BU064_03900 [Staphylococcus succinus]|nr:hypothetical protein BU064_03900 [Staphylococcus succinus]
MIKRFGLILITLVTLSTLLSPITEAIGTSSGASTSSSSSASSSASSSGARGSMNSSAARTSVRASMNNARSLSSQRANAMLSKSSSLARPHTIYSAGSSYKDQRRAAMYFNNSLFYWIVMNNHNINMHKQQQLLKQNMRPKEKLYTITVKGKDHKDHVLVVTKKDYDTIQKGAHVKYKNGEIKVVS